MNGPAPVVLARLVRAVADPARQAIRVAPDNSNAGFVDLDDAVAHALSGDAVAVCPHPRLIVFDLDPDGSGTDTAAFDALAGELVSAGLHPVVVASGRPGHRHLFCVCPPGRLRAGVQARARRAGIDVREGFARIRPPGVAHRSGAAPELVAPDGWPAALEALSPTRPATKRSALKGSAAAGPRQPDQVEQRLAAAGDARPPGSGAAGFDEAGPGEAGSAPGRLTPPDAGSSGVGALTPRPDETFAPPADRSARPSSNSTSSQASLLEGLPGVLVGLIRDGDVEGRYSAHGGSGLTMAIANRAANADVPLELLRRLLADPSNAGGDAYRRRMGRKSFDADLWLDHTYAKAVATRWTRRRSGPVPAQLAELSRGASMAVFKGRTAATDRAALFGAVTIAQRYGSLITPLSVRDLAEASGLNADTARKAMRRLRDLGWFQLLRCSSGDRAAVYRLQVPDEGFGDTGSCPDPARSADPAGVARQPVTGVVPMGGVGLAGNSAKPRESAGPAHPDAPAQSGGALHAPDGTGMEVDLGQLDLAGDAWAHGALGKAGAAAWCALRSAGPISVGDLAKGLGRNAGALRRTLRRLAEHGAASRDSQGRWSACLLDEADLENVAAERGTDGRAQRRRQRHCLQRRAYRESLAERLFEYGTAWGSGSGVSTPVLRGFRSVSRQQGRRRQGVWTPPRSRSAPVGPVRAGRGGPPRTPMRT